MMFSPLLTRCINNSYSLMVEEDFSVKDLNIYGDQRKNINIKIIGALFLSIGISILGVMYVVVKVVGDIVPPFKLVWTRYEVAVVVLAIIGDCMKQS